MIDLSNCCRHCGCIDPTDGIVTDLRARVTELEATRTTAIREAVERLSDEVIARELSSPGDWWFDRYWRSAPQDAASFRAALLAALLPAPAPGRDTDGPGTTTSRDLVSEANVTSNASIAAGGDDGE